MGYRIIYLPERKKKRVWPWAALLLGVGLLCVSLFPQGRQAIETALLPGEPERTRQALVNLAQAELGWKKSTTYTVLKKLCDRGIFQNQGGIVTSRISRQDFFAMQSEKFVEETFAGSLPAFLAAFTKRKPLSQQEIAEIRRMIDSFGGE